MDSQSFEFTPQVKRIKYDENIERLGEALEDISTLTEDYVNDRLPYLMEEIQHTSNITSILPILEGLNTPSEGKKYIISYKSDFLFKKGDEIIRFKNIHPFSLNVSIHFSGYIVSHIKKILSKSYSDAEFSLIYKNVIYYKDVLKHVSNPKSKIYSMFKTKLITT